jgi:CDP-glucose 4,6-dehydratase
MVTSVDSLSSILERSFRGRRVLITGHNGFVGSWLSLILARSGADVTGLSLPSEAGGLAEALDLSSIVRSIEGDVRESTTLRRVVADSAPEIVFHLAAQSKVLPSYVDPVYTFATNVMGTANVLDSLRGVKGVQSCVVVTSDKCYAIADRSHVETDALGGDDPYSASKAGAEIVTHAYRTSFFAEGPVAIATARAGNIVGGGDWAEDRLVPDVVRAVRDGSPIVLRRPDAIRPWQHVLDAVAGYLRLSDALERSGVRYAQAWNFGPSADEAVRVRELVTRFEQHWTARGGAAFEVRVEESIPAERSTLVLDSDRARESLGWHPRLDLDTTLDWTAEWYSEALRSTSFDARRSTTDQIERFVKFDDAASLGAHELTAAPPPISPSRS